MSEQVSLRDELQARIGLLPKVSSLSEITRLVRAARTLGLRVRSGNAPACLATDDFDVIVDTDFIADEERIVLLPGSGDSGARLVTVKPGVTVREFNEFCLSRDLCLPSLPDSPQATMVELAMTGAAGDAPAHSAISDFITDIRIVDADGRLKHYRCMVDDSEAVDASDARRREKRDLFSGAQCHLGMFGVVYDATFQVQKNFTVSVTTEFKPLEEVLLNPEAIEEMLARNQNVSVYWFPFNSVRGAEDPMPGAEQDAEAGEEKKEDGEEERDEGATEKEEEKEDEQQDEDQQEVEQTADEVNSEAELQESAASRQRTPPPELYSLDDWTPNRDEVFCRYLNTCQLPSQAKREFDLIDPVLLDPETGCLLGDPVDSLRRTHRRHRRQQPAHSEYQQHVSWGINWMRPDTYPAGLKNVEYVFDAGKEFNNTVRCVGLVAERVQEYKKRGQFPLNCCLCVSFARASDALMAPGHCAHPTKGGTGRTCAINVLMLPQADSDAETDLIGDFVLDLEMDLRGVEGARPHWSSNWAFVEGSHAMLKKVYTEDLAQFKNMIRRKLIDLDGVFLNRHLARVVESDEFACQQLAMATGGGISGADALHLISVQPVNKCASIAFDAKFNLLVEAAGDDGLRFRQSNLPPPGSVEASQATRVIFSEVFRYLNVQTSHIALTPYNIMLCCHGNSLSMVRHCTGQVVYRCELPCKVGGAAFDAASDSFFVCDAATKSVLCMPYMEFERSRRLDVTQQIVPSGLCVFSSTLFVANSEVRDGLQPCGICYRLEDGRVFKISRVAVSKKVVTGTQQTLSDAMQKHYRPSALDGVVVLPQAGSQQSKATLIGISSADKAMYTYRVRFRRSKDASSSSGVIVKFRGRDEASFIDVNNGAVRVPRFITALSNECIVVYFEVQALGSRPESHGVMVFRFKSAVTQGINTNPLN
uniref:FAD-binding PCMH-type domain-containing protein n=1 Tax=Macrostomum lignano TaxID=282301 RepID=A0A1I8GWR6_9PLAT